jgi:outer membrane biosynthesis protein TonB
MQTGAILSSLLHLGLIAMAVLGLPRWVNPEPLDQQVISIEFIAEVAEERSAPPPPPEPEPEPEPAKAPEPPPPPKEIAKAEPEPPPEPEPEKAPKPPAPPKAATPAPRPAPAPKAKPKPPPRPKPKVAEKQPEPPKPEDFLSRMRKAVAKHEPPPVTPPPQPRLARADVPTTRLGDFSKRLTMSEEDAVRRHIARCWNPPSGARDVRDMEVRIIGNLRRDGLVHRVRVVDGDKARMRQDPFFRTFAESALRAFYKCGQLPLPPDKYESWKAFNIGFNLKEMLGQ